MPPGATQQGLVAGMGKVELQTTAGVGTCQARLAMETGFEVEGFRCTVQLGAKQASQHPVRGNEPVAVLRCEETSGPGALLAGQQC